MNMQTATSATAPTSQRRPGRSLFRKARNESAFVKASLMGFQGSGKTFTATGIAIGTILHCRELGLPYADKPVYFLDSEKGSDWVIPQFEKAGIELRAAKTRAFSDLADAVDDAEENASLLLVDSLTHFWVEFTEAYKTKKQRRRGLEFQDWAFLKQEWRTKFVDRFVGSQLHMILCGRAGFEYEHYVDDAGKKQIEKSGIKMRAESETGYESDLLVYMERETDMESSTVVRVAHIFKDRSTLIDGKEFKNPNFKSFAPHIMSLNFGGVHRGTDTARTSSHMIPQDTLSKDNYGVQRDIVIEETKELLQKHFGGQSEAAKQQRSKHVAEYFETTSWTEVEKVMSLRTLRSAFDRLHQHLEKMPSRYADLLAENRGEQELDDAIPEPSSAPVKGQKAIRDEGAIFAAEQKAAENFAKGDTRIPDEFRTSELREAYCNSWEKTKAAAAAAKKTASPPAAGKGVAPAAAGMAADSGEKAAA